jgi:predicted SnoaL-like aldol condensation-catalyzing enzyme
MERLSAEPRTDNKRLMSKYIETIWNAGEFERIDEFVRPDFVGYDPVLADLQGPQAIVKQMRDIHRHFPELRFEILDQVAEDDKVVTRWSARAKVRRNKAPVELTGMTLARFEDGRVAESWLERDSAVLVNAVAPNVAFEALNKFAKILGR